MHAEDFGWEIIFDGTKTPYIYDGEKAHYADNESRFLTQQLGITYADEEDNNRKANSVDKYKKMAQRHPAVFRKPFVRWLMKRTWGKKLMFLFFGKKRDKKNSWPEWVTKTDEERIQNMPWILEDKGEWVITEKIDGSSTTFTMRRGKHNKYEFYVCSRNVCFDSVNKRCYYDTNIYWEMAEKYDMYNMLLAFLLGRPNVEWVTIQGETFGAGVQKRDYSLEGHDFRAFNLITSDKGRWGTLEMKELLEKHYHIPCVPVVLPSFKFEGFDVDKLLAFAEGNSMIDGKPREGFVFRSKDGQRSFKAVSNSFLLKYHG